MLDSVNAASSGAASSPDRSALAEAHTARREAETALASAREAADRGAELLASAETEAQRHRAAAAQQTAQRAASLTAAIRAGHGDMPHRPPAGAGRGEAAALLVAEQEAEAARQAAADLEADVQRAEAAAASAKAAVDRAIKGVLAQHAKALKREKEQAEAQVRLLTSRLRGYENTYNCAGGFTVGPLQFEVMGSLGETELWSRFYQKLNEDASASLDD